MKIKDVQLSILCTELGETVIPTQGAVDKFARAGAADKASVAACAPTRKPAMNFRAVLFGADPARLDAWLTEVTASVFSLRFQEFVPEPNSERWVSALVWLVRSLVGHSFPPPIGRIRYPTGFN